MNNAKPNIVADTFKILILNIGNHYFGAPIESIQDVIQRNPTTPVPLTPPQYYRPFEFAGAYCDRN